MPSEVIAVPDVLDPAENAAAPFRPDPLAEALAHLQRSPNGTVTLRDPETGAALAVLSRPEVAAPPRLGGMATPLGVYLTDGVVGGGAGFWGLFLTGVAMAGLSLAAQALTLGLLTLSARHGWDVTAWADSPQHAPAVRAALTEALSWLPVPVIFLLLRLTPMAGIHAAEHQAVHCLERGLPLTVPDVRAQPRVHPRCGTNFFTGFVLFLLTFVSVFRAALPGQGVDGAATVAVIAAGMVALLLWRRVGAFVQQWLATRPATDRQIRSAIRAAEQVLHRRRRMPDQVAFRPLRRLWSMGLLPVLAGCLALYGPLLLAADRWPALNHWLSGF